MYSPDDKDIELIRLLNQMDDYISDNTPYDEWEDHYFKIEEKCRERYVSWLKFKGLDEFIKDFPHNVEVYLNFIYRYTHDDEINLKIIFPIYMQEFFSDYLLRKVLAEPYEYVQWPPALKLFYQFLQEIGYIEDIEKIIKLFDALEPYFINILKERYS